MDVYRDTSPVGSLQHGHTSVGKVAAPLSAVSADCQWGILLRAPGAGDPVPNTEMVWVGGPAVTADSAAGSGGLPLLPGAAIELPVNDPSQVYVISTEDGQEVAWLGAS